MAIRVTCTDCGMEFTAKDRFAGRTVKCKECGNEIVIDPEPTARTGDPESGDQVRERQTGTREPSRHSKGDRHGRSGRGTRSRSSRGKPPKASSKLPIVLAGLFLVLVAAGVVAVVVIRPFELLSKRRVAETTGKTGEGPAKEASVGPLPETSPPSPSVPSSPYEMLAKTDPALASRIKGLVGRTGAAVKSDRTAASDELFRIGAPAIDILFFELARNENALIRVNASFVLSRLAERKLIGEEAHLEKLMLALGDEDRLVRVNARCAMQYVGKRSLPFLTGGLKSPKATVRLTSAIALGFMGDKESVPHLGEVMQDREDDVRCQVVWALGKIGGKSAYEFVKGAVGDESYNVRAECGRAFGNIGIQDAKGHVVRLWREDSERYVNIVAAAAYARLFDAAEAYVYLIKSMETRDWEYARDELISLGIPSARHLLKALEFGGDDLKARCHHALAGIGDGIIPILTSALPGAGKYMKMDICIVFSSLGDKGIDALFAALVDPGLDCAVQAATALGGVGGASVCRRLIDAYHESGENVKPHIIIALSKVRSKEAVEFIVDATTDPSDIARGIAIVTLNRMGNEVIEPLIEALRDGDPAKRRCALELLKAKTGKDFGLSYEKWRDWHLWNK